MKLIRKECMIEINEEGESCGYFKDVIPELRPWVCPADLDEIMLEFNIESLAIQKIIDNTPYPVSSVICCMKCGECLGNSNLGKNTLKCLECLDKEQDAQCR